MRISSILLILLPLQLHAAFDLGVGVSSFTSGRSVPSLAAGVDFQSFGINARSTGVQTSIYAQNAWTTAVYAKILTEQLGPGSSGVATLGAGFGASYIMRSYRESVDDPLEKVSEYVLGPYFSLKYVHSGIYIGADAILGVRGEHLTQALTMNYQDMAFISVGISL